MLYHDWFKKTPKEMTKQQSQQKIKMFHGQKQYLSVRFLLFYAFLRRFLWIKTRVVNAAWYNLTLKNFLLRESNVQEAVRSRRLSFRFIWPSYYFSLWTTIICQFKSDKGNGAEMCHAIVSVIVNENAPVSCCTVFLLFLITVLEAYAKVNVTPPPFWSGKFTVFHSRRW